MKAKGKIEKTLRAIRRAEEEIAVASPKRAAQLASRIARLKATVFDDE